jgi:cobalt/nickel transport system permease protein
MSPSSATPSWLLEAEVGLCPCGCVGKRRRTSFTDRTLDGLARVMRQALFSDDVARAPGVLQRLDPRVKLAALFALLLAAGLVHHVWPLAALYAVTLVLAGASRISLGFFVRRVWLFIPIFTGIVVIPAAFSFVTPGDIVVGLGNWLGHDIGLTRQGLESAALIVSRVATSISLVVLVTITTPWPALLAAVRSLRVPATFVMIIGMAYRYLFVLLGSVGEMYTARKARTLGPDRDVRAGRRYVAASAGALFGRAHALSDEVHQAMVARGWRGEPVLLDAPRLRAADVGWLMGCAVLAIVVVGGDRVLLG